MLTLQTEKPAVLAQQQATPALIFETLNRYQHSLALRGAIDLEIFTHIASGSNTARAIAEKACASVRGVRILCDFLTILRFLDKSGERYSLTRDSALFLDKRSPAYAGSIANFMVNDCALSSFHDVATLVKDGGNLGKAVSTAEGSDVWVHFARSMKPIAKMSAKLMAPFVTEPDRRMKVLDVAAGHGMFGIEVALYNGAADIYALDWDCVLDVAAENAAQVGLSHRFHRIPGSAFEVDLGHGYDLILIPNFLHHFDRQENVALLNKIRMALKPKGTVATLEFIPNEDRVSPPIAASFSMMMLGRTAHGDAYTFSEFDSMFREAGFANSTLHDLEPLPHRLILSS